MAADALVFAVVGAESTGKTVLAQALAERVAAETGLACTWVPEHLRLWCDREGRTPQQHEQAGIAAAQAGAIAAAAATHDVVIADTTPLMTAVYSVIVFGDRSLLAGAGAWQRTHCALTLLTALDLPWQADGLQRDGPHVRMPVDALIRDALAQHALPWALVAGSGTARVDAALDALAPLLRRRATPRRGLFTRLSDRSAVEDRPYSCEFCDDPDCEHRSFVPR